MTNSTVAQNKADGYAGGISAGFSSTANLNAVTIARNVADRDGSGGAGGGGIRQFGGAVVTVKNTLIALNKAGDPGDTGHNCLSEASDFDSKGHNLLSNHTDCTGFDAGGDKVRKNPKIGQLANNGGPTRTISLDAGSPAIGAAGGGMPSRDQRGHRRDAHPDVGAFER